MLKKDRMIAISMFGFVLIFGEFAACLPFQPVRTKAKEQKSPWSMEQSEDLRWVFPPVSKTPRMKMGRIVSPPILGRNALYITTLDGKLHAIGFHGKRLWTFKDPSNPNDLIVSSPTVTPEGNIFFGTKNLFLYGVSPSGKARWKDLVRGSVTTTPMTLNQAVYVPLSSRGVLQVFSNQGTRKWSYTIEGGGDEQRLMTPIPAPNGTIYLASQDGKLHVLSSKTKQLLWKKKFCARIAAPPIIGVSGQLFLSCWTRHKANSGLWKGELLNIRLRDRKIVWRFQTKAPILASPVLSSDEDTVYIGSDDTYFYAVNAKSGKLQWRFQSGKYEENDDKWSTKPEKNTSAFFQSSPCLDSSGNIYVGSVNHFLYQLSDEGKLLWQKNLGGWITHAPVLRKNPVNGKSTLYIAAGRRLFAFKPQD